MESCNIWKRQKTKIAQEDLSNEYEDVYTIIKPYTKGNGKGSEWLNDTKYPKKVKTGRINIQEKINSYRDETNYHILIDKYNKGELIGIDASAGTYADVSGLSNVNMFNVKETMAAAQNSFNKLTDEEKLIVAKILNFKTKEQTKEEPKEQPKEEEGGKK